MAGIPAVRPAQVPKTSRRRSKLSLKRILLGYALVAPVVVWRTVTSVYPFLYTLYLSFFDNSPVRQSFDFIGLENYAVALKDHNVVDTIGFTFYFMAVSVSLQIVIALLTAQLLNGRFFGRNLVRAINLLPWALAGIVTATAARWVFDTEYGLINDLLWRAFDIRPIWLVDVGLARFAVVLTDVWKNTPFLTVVFIGGLQGISPEIYEAAKIDGSSGVKAFWYITLPLIAPLVISMAIFISIYRILSFEIVYGLTQGGPGMATALMSYVVYLQGFRVLNFGYASAVAMGLFVIVLVIGLLGYGLLRRAWARL